MVCPPLLCSCCVPSNPSAALDALAPALRRLLALVLEGGASFGEDGGLCCAAALSVLARLILGLGPQAAPALLALLSSVPLEAGQLTALVQPAVAAAAEAGGELAGMAMEQVGL